MMNTASILDKLMRSLINWLRKAKWLFTYLEREYKWAQQKTMKEVVFVSNVIDKDRDAFIARADKILTKLGR